MDKIMFRKQYHTKDFLYIVRYARHRSTHAMQWAITNDPRITPKCSPKTIGLAVLFLRQVVSLSLCQGASRDIDFIGNLINIAPTTHFACKLL